MNEDMETQARALFERSVQQLDEVAVRRLRLARRSTLASTSAARSRAWPAGVAAAAMLVLGLAWWLPRAAPAPAPSATGPAAVAEEPVLAEADEDADLYAWLGEAPVAADDPEQQL